MGLKTRKILGRPVEFLSKAQETAMHRQRISCLRQRSAGSLETRLLRTILTDYELQSR